MKKIAGLFLLSLLSGASTLTGYRLWFDKSDHSNTIVTTAPASYAKNVGFSGDALDFTVAADKTVHSVVHVRNVSYKTVSNPIAAFFYGYSSSQQQEQIGTGSGVIISEDGYIVTNNHVVKDASDIEITLNNNKTYKAKLVGTDSKMDIALLKINSDEKLSFSVFADSDNVKVGEWVLAVGNPYNLNSTVTAGIISAKARNLGTNGIQSFLQTDAAVNPGNSGGALVNSRGELIGINTMISSQTGSYVGYSFAIPSNIARKIIQDIMEFGNVQRGILGVQGGELNGNISKELGLKESQGFYVEKVSKGTGAEKAGIIKGDIIVKLDNQKVATYSDLSGYISTKSPKDIVKVSIIRNEKPIEISVSLSKNEISNTAFKGLEFENMDANDKKSFKINYGIKIKDLDNEKLNSYANDLKGGIVLRIDNIKIIDLEMASKIIENKDENQSVQIEMLTNSGHLLRLIL